MATYVFKAMDLTGAKATGEVDADSKQVVSDQLKSRGLIVLDIKDKHKSREINLEIFNKLKATDLAVLTRQLATMVQSGMTILRALYVLEAQTENKMLTNAVIAVRKDVEAGLPLSDALERHPKIFDPLFVSMTRAGETGGMLDESLIRVADQLEKADSLRRQVKSAMTYPIVVLTFAGGILLALVAFLVPVFIGVFKQFGGGTIADPLKASPAFPTMVTHMVAVGEETGSLDTMLSKIADFYEDQVDAAVKSLTSILEPIMIIVVGGIVGFIVISMYLPLFKVYDAIK